MMQSTKLINVLKVLFAVVAWGASFIATKVALRDVSPLTVVWLRFAMGVLIIGVAVAARGQLKLPSWRDAGYFMLLGFLGIAYHQWLQSTGLQTAQASTTAWIVATTPIFMALLGVLVLKERLNLLQVGGIALATIGVLVVVSGGDLGALGMDAQGMPGNLYILASAPNWAIFSVLSRRGLREHSPAWMMFYVMGFGWLISSIGFFAGPGIAEIPQLTMNGWWGILFLGIACSGLAYVFWYDALRAIPASQVGAYLYLEPLVAVGVAAVILAEPIFFVSLLGGAAILLGVYLVERPSKTPTVTETQEI
ncbi:MAG: DMT family transporter [Chloroflexi bacterium]|nr:DMT family transporter [Chloroflexota bacterium]